MSSVKSKSHGDALLVIVILLMVLVIALVSASAVIKKPELAKYVVPAFASPHPLLRRYCRGGRRPEKLPFSQDSPAFGNCFPISYHGKSAVKSMNRSCMNYWRTTCWQNEIIEANGQDSGSLFVSVCEREPYSWGR